MNKPQHKDDELLELGKKLQTFYEMGYISRKDAYVFSFVKGLLSGAGAFIGGTLVITLILWLLSLFGHLPFIGHIIQSVQQTLHK